MPLIKPSDLCDNCGHAYEVHASDYNTTTERCWAGSATGNGCSKECKSFIPKQ